MKILLMIGALIAPFFVSAQALYDNSQSEPKFEVTETLYKVGSSSSDKSLYKQLGTMCATAPAEDDTVGPHYTSTRDCYVKNYWGTGQAYRIEWTIDTWSVDSDGNEYNRAESVANTTLSYYEGTVIKCGEDANGSTSYTFMKNDLCYDPFLLEQEDSCNLGDVLPPTDSTADVCSQKSDGSRCVYESVSSDNGENTWFTQKAEPSSCYETPEPPAFEPQNPSMTSDDCVAVGGVTVMCPEIQSNVCDESGNCQTGCGSFSFDGSEEQYVCFSSDQDGDLSPDYKDTDMDGDGTPNDSDPDYSTPTGTNYANGGGNTDTGTGTDTGTETGTGETTIDVSGIEERLDGITEILDNESVEGMPTKSDLDTGFDSIIDSSVNEIKNEFGKSADEICIDGKCGSTLSGDETEFLDTAFGTFSVASCVNPVWIKGQTLDFCSKAPKINEFLYWIIALLTTLFLFNEFHTTLRRNT